MLAIKLILILQMKCTFMHNEPMKILDCQERYTQEILKEVQKIKKRCKND